MMELTSSSSPTEAMRSAYEPACNVTANTYLGMNLHKNATNIWKYFSPVLIACGTVGNAFSIVVLRLPEMRSLTITRLLVALAILDIVVLTFTLTPKWLQFGLNLINDPEDNMVWQIQQWLAQSIGMVDHWTMVLFSIDRALSVFRPLSTWIGRYESIRGRIRFGTLCLVCVLLNSHVIYDIVCQSKKEKDKRAMDTWKLWTVVITFILPFVFIVLLNSAILCKLRNRYGEQWYREETEQKRAKATTTRVNMAFDDEVDRSKKGHSEREGREIEQEEGEAGDIYNDIEREGKGQSERRRERIEGKKEPQGSARLEENKPVDVKTFHTSFDGTAEYRSSTTVCQAQRNIRAHLVMNFIFLATDLPIVAFLSVNFVRSTATFSSSFLAFTICDHMMYLRHTFSFFAFGISEQFRKAVLRLITKCAAKQTAGRQEQLMVSLGDQKDL